MFPPILKCLVLKIFRVIIALIFRRLSSFIGLFLVLQRITLSMLFCLRAQQIPGATKEKSWLKEMMSLPV